MPIMSMIIAEQEPYGVLKVRTDAYQGSIRPLILHRHRHRRRPDPTRWGSRKTDR